MWCSINVLLQNVWIKKMPQGHLLCPPVLSALSPWDVRKAAGNGPRRAAWSSGVRAGQEGGGLPTTSLHQNRKSHFIKYFLSPLGARPCGWCCGKSYLVYSLLLNSLELFENKHYITVNSHLAISPCALPPASPSPQPPSSLPAPEVLECPPPLRTRVSWPT